LNETPTPDWDAIEREVIRKLRYLRAAWEHTAANEPELHELMKRDLRRQRQRPPQRPRRRPACSTACR
jgi:hypothetical protein